MQPQLPPAPDNPDAEPLLTPDEFRVLAARIHRNANLSGALFNVAVYSVLNGIIVGAIVSLWVRLALVMECAVIYGLVLALTMGVFSAFARREGREVERLLRFITCTQEVAMLGGLLDLKDASWHPGGIHARFVEAVDAAVLRLLPSVQTAHAGTLNKKQRSRIGYYLWTGSSFKSTRGFDNLPYARGVLHALEQIGDKHDLPGIESTLNAVHVTEEFRAAVQHCADTIRERVAREEGKDVLLRADRKPEAAETLLRPSIENADTPPQQLLRAVASDEGNRSA